MSSLPVEVLEEATSIAKSVTGEKSVQTSLLGELPSKVKTYKLGSQLVQVARNSLLDIDGLRYIQNSIIVVLPKLKDVYIRILRLYLKSVLSCMRLALSLFCYPLSRS